MKRRLPFSLLASLVLHLTTLFLADRLWFEEQEMQAYRARLLSAHRFVQRRPPPALRPALPRAEMEFRRLGTVPSRVPEAPLPTPAPAPPEAGADPAHRLSPDELPSPKARGPSLGREEMPPPTELALVDSTATETLELLRIEDMMRADRERAVVILDPDGRRDTRGFVKFTPLHLDGAWSEWLNPDQPVAARGVPVLADLARYLRDYTRLSAEVRTANESFFLSRRLLRDPIHFLFPGYGSGAISSATRVQMSAEERLLLGEYLRSGGFLFIDAGQGSDDRRFLRAMVAILRDVLSAEGRLEEVPPDHGIYQAFYSFGLGFPGEYKRPVVRTYKGSWYYPDLAPETSYYPRGLWGLWLGEELVGVISDLNLHSLWSETATPGEGGVAAGAEGGQGVIGGEGIAVATATTTSTTPYLRAATNVVFYALTREGGLATKRGRPAWERRRPVVRPEVREENLAGEDESLYDVLGASLALVLAPLGKQVGEGGLQLRVDAGDPIEVVDGGAHGILLRNLASGRQRIEVAYAGGRQELVVNLPGGQVTTVLARVRGLGLLRVLSLKTLEERVATREWMARFEDLRVEEVFVGEPWAAASPHVCSTTRGEAGWYGEDTAGCGSRLGSGAWFSPVL